MISQKGHYECLVMFILDMEDALLCAFFFVGVQLGHLFYFQSLLYYVSSENCQFEFSYIAIQLQYHVPVYFWSIQPKITQNILSISFSTSFIFLEVFVRKFQCKLNTMELHGLLILLLLEYCPIVFFYLVSSLPALLFSDYTCTIHMSVIHVQQSNKRIKFHFKCYIPQQVQFFLSVLKVLMFILI